MVYTKLGKVILVGGYFVLLIKIITLKNYVCFWNIGNNFIAWSVGIVVSQIKIYINMSHKIYQYHKNKVKYSRNVSYTRKVLPNFHEICRGNNCIIGEKVFNNTSIMAWHYKML